MDWCLLIAPVVYVVADFIRLVARPAAPPHPWAERKPGETLAEQVDRIALRDGGRVSVTYCTKSRGWVYTKAAQSSETGLTYHYRRVLR